VHRGLYEKGWLARKRLPRPVVCVGNLTAGGAGKTPVVLWLAEQLLRRGYRPAVLTRGYRRETAADSVVLTGADAGRAPVNGDETQLLLRRLMALGADVPVGVGGDRYRTGVAVGEQHDVDVFLLDDGFQHWKLERDFDLVLEDATRPFGGGGMMPLGRLREGPGGLCRAGAILLTRTRRGGGDHGLRDEIRRHNAVAPIYRSRDRAVGFIRVGSGEEIESGALSGTPVLAFSGIGNPASFERTLEGTGVRPVEVLRFRDHHRYGSGDVTAILEAAREHRASAMVTTEKDLMNLWHVVRDGGEQDWEVRVAERFGPLPLYWLRSEVEVDDGESLLDQMEQTILQAGESPSGGRARERMEKREIDGDDQR
jgi:tetraacyldisaccharide 4'-kinase